MKTQGGAMKLQAILVFVLAGVIFGREAKEGDKDVNYEEAKVPAYDLPELLVTSEGKRITTAKEWREVRRPQIMGLFGNLIYGRVPESATPLEVGFREVKREEDFMGGKATRKDVDILLKTGRGEKTMRIVVYVPNGAKKPVPMILKHSFNNTKSDDFKQGLLKRDRLKNGWPLGKILDAGFGFCAVFHEDLVRHNEVSFRNSIHGLFYPEGQSFPKAHEWGVLSACAWGGMRALDYLEIDEEIDATRVAVMGHSKMGKTALWTAAQDERFAMAISAQSGCAGAALWRRKSGETLKKMVTRFPYWLCRNAQKFVEQEDDLPVDQHMLLACIAPRPVYVHSGVEDTWADGRGEYLSAFHASEVYRLLGKKGLDNEESPPVGEAVMEGEVGYHIRAGGHSIEDEDWEHFIKFALKHLGGRE